MYSKEQVAVEISNFFIEKHGYKSLKLKTVEGIFLENRDRDIFQIIKISVDDIINLSEEQVQLEAQLLVKTVNEYQILSSLKDVKILNVVIGSTYQIQSDFIKTININMPEDFNSSDVIRDHFHVNDISYISTNKTKDIIKSERDVMMLLRESQTKAIRMFKQQTRFSSTLRTSIMIFMLVLMFQGYNYTNIPLMFGYFHPFVSELNEWYRLFFSILINDSLLSAFFIILIIKQPLVQLELLIKTKNIIIYTILGLIAFYAYLFFVGSETYFIGSYPLIHLYLGGIIHVIVNRKDFDIKGNYKMFVSSFLIFASLAILLLSTDMYLTMYCLVMGYFIMSLFGKANILSKAIHITSYTLAIAFITYSFMSSNIVRYYSVQIQNSYITYLKEVDPEYAKVVESKLDLTIPSDGKK